MELELQHASSFRSNRSDTERSLPAEGRVDDEVKLQWAAIDRLPTFRRLRTSLFDDGKVSGSQNNPDVAGKRVVDIMKLGGLERHMFIENLLKRVEDDNFRLLQKLKERIDRQEKLMTFNIIACQTKT
ncbi:ABC transporter G family member 37-like [Punica granatum]|uniref:ABC transporter G family member 37-like n=1 Tax=Punica granatum TaxID=22663 RepID=A0A6P8CAR3_PUNGR|nr:ABC transporter G family member 37-like [Punica granatum]